MMNFIYGLLVSGSLIMAIGAQNTHVIRYGVARRNIFFVALTCFLCDALLISSGVFLIGSASQLNKSINISICLLSILFLLYYAFNAFKSALRQHQSNELVFDPNNHPEPIIKSIMATLAVTLLNPHVYLDTVVLLGGYASSLNFTDKIFFTLGALITSLSWFFALGYFSKYLSRFFKMPKTWVIVDFGVSLLMLVMAINLINYLLRDVL